MDSSKNKLCTVIRLSVRITWGIIRHYYLLFMCIFIFQYMYMHVCVSFYISIFELSLCIYIFISVSILLDSYSGLSSNSKPEGPNGINFRGFLLAALGDTGHTRPAENQSINEEKNSLSCRSSSRPPSSSPSDKTVWIAAIQADPHHSFPPEVVSSSWSWPLVLLSRTHFFIPALWLLLLIKKRKLSRFEIQEKKLRPTERCFYRKSRVSQTTGLKSEQ